MIRLLCSVEHQCDIYTRVHSYQHPVSLFSVFLLSMPIRYFPFLNISFTSLLFRVNRLSRKTCYPVFSIFINPQQQSTLYTTIIPSLFWAELFIILTNNTPDNQLLSIFNFQYIDVCCNKAEE